MRAVGGTRRLARLPPAPLLAPCVRVEGHQWPNQLTQHAWKVHRVVVGCCAHCRPQCWPGVWVDRWALQTWGADSSLGALPSPVSDQLQQIMHAATCTKTLPPLGSSPSRIINCYIKAKASNQIGKQLQLRSGPTGRQRSWAARREGNNGPCGRCPALQGRASHNSSNYDVAAAGATVN